MICDVKKRFCPAVTRALIKQKFKKAGTGTGGTPMICDVKKRFCPAVMRGLIKQNI